MTDEEKEAIKDLKEVIDLYNDKCLITTEDDFKSIEILLNLIEKQSKEIEELKEKNRQGKMRIVQLENEITARIEDVNKYFTPNDKIKAKIQEVEQWELYNMKIPRLSTLDERLGAKIGIKYVLQSLLRKEFPVTITKEELEKRWKE